MAKSELILAFNEIAETRKLPREVIIEALKAALVSAYRRNTGVSAAQRVEARVDERTGEPTVWVEREVVEEVQSPQTEVALEDARLYDPEAQLGDMVLVNDTPEDFGRIAAQTAKQVILQRMREAERDAQYQEYMDRVGDLVTGTVQSASGDVVTIGLGRTEALLPRSQQVPGERYRMHDKVRAYVMEVRRSNRGPQIVVSRTHRNMLRRLLEYEVPEIYNGTVEIKSIAREPGARSKVAVSATQPGADPVGACVGMRGVRIQSIVRELNNEKIDVIEWSADQPVFISKALSPARVSAVFLDDDPMGGRTATVVVPDDQLSLAIGREGQNARLAAKLTGWRIDIKSVMEAAQDAYASITTEADLAQLAEANMEMVARVAAILEKKEAAKPIMPEDYHVLIDFVKLVENYRQSLRDASREEVLALRQQVREQVPPAAYLHPLDDTDLPLRTFNMLEEAGFTSVGDVMEQHAVDPQYLLTVLGSDQAALAQVEEMLRTIELREPEPEEPEMAAEEAEAVVEAEPAAEMVAEAAELEGEVQEAIEIAAAGPADEFEDEEARERRARLVAQMLASQGMAAVEADQVAAGEEMDEAAELEPFVDAAEAYSGADEGVDAVLDEAAEFEEEEVLLDSEEEEVVKQRAKQRRRQLVFDEEAGRMVAKRRRKGSREADKWTDAWEDIDEE